jgi:tetratricopeptide (TPR) repeat protein
MARVRAIFDERIAEKPDDAARLSDRAWFKERLFDLAGAEADYTAAIKLDPSAARFVERASLRGSRGDHAGALTDARAAYDLEPGNDDARRRLASELAIAGKVDEAIDLLPASPDLATDDGIQVLMQKVEILEFGDRDEEAMALVDEALVKRPASAELHNTRCWFKALRNTDLDGALADCNRAIELSSEPARFLDSRALVHFRAQRMPQAKVDYEAALASSPEQASSLFMDAVVLDRLGDRAAASTSLSAARKIYPDVGRFYQRFGIAAPPLGR